MAGERDMLAAVFWSLLVSSNKINTKLVTNLTMSGKIQVSKSGNIQRFLALKAGYPVKYITPRRRLESDPCIVFALSYGGGLVSNDHFHVEIIIDEACALCYMTQASTKVFKQRKGNDVSTLKCERSLISALADIGQSMNVHVYLWF